MKFRILREETTVKRYWMDVDAKDMFQAKARARVGHIEAVRDKYYVDIFDESIEEITEIKFIDKV